MSSIQIYKLHFGKQTWFKSLAVILKDSLTPKVQNCIYWRICMLSNQETSSFSSQIGEFKVWLNYLLQFYRLWKSRYLWIRQRRFELYVFNGFNTACWSADRKYNIATYTWWNWYFLIFLTKPALNKPCNGIIKSAAISNSQFSNSTVTATNYTTLISSLPTEYM